MPKSTEKKLAITRLKELVHHARTTGPVDLPKLARTANAALRGINGGHSANATATLFKAGNLLQDHHLHKNAIPVLEQALEMARQNRNYRQSAKIAARLAFSCQCMGMLKKSEKALVIALEAVRNRQDKSVAMRLEKALESLRCGFRFSKDLVVPDGPPDEIHPDPKPKSSTFVKRRLPPPFIEPTKPLFEAQPGRFTPSTTSTLETGKDLSIEYFRVEVETWLRNYPEPFRNDFRTRLWHRNDATHLSAFYELFFHEYCLRQGWKIEVEPKIAGSHPDFHVASGHGEFLLEVGTFGDSNFHPDTIVAAESVLACLDSLRTNYLLSVKLLSVDKEVDLLALRRHVESWLIRHDAFLEPAHLALCDYGVKAHLVAVERDTITATGSVYKWTLPPAKNTRSEESNVVSKALDKDRKYMKSWDGPLLLAACTRENTVLDDLTLCMELFGPASMELASDGSLSVTCAAEGGRFRHAENQDVSALMLCSRRWDRCRMVFDMRVIHNPWANHPLSPYNFPGHRQLVPVSDSDHDSTIKLVGSDWNQLTFRF